MIKMKEEKNNFKVEQDMDEDSIDKKFIEENYTNSYDYEQMSIVKNFIYDTYNEQNENFNQLDNKAYSFFNMSILILTIQFSFLSGVITNFVCCSDFLVFHKIIFLILYSLNILFNVFAISFFYNSYKLATFKTNLKNDKIMEYFDNKVPIEKMINQLINTLNNAISNNGDKLENKIKNINNGSKCLMSSITFLTISMVFYLILYSLKYIV